MTTEPIILALDSSTATSTSQSKHIGIESLEQHCRIVEEELQTLRESEQRFKQQNAESQRRERILVRRLALKEQEMQDYVVQIGELKAAQAPGPTALRNALLDPAINIMFQKLKVELQTTRARLEETQNELSAWKFTPDSTTGKRLMAKCRLLYQENEELGKMTSNGRLAKLEGDLALQKSFSEEVKKSQSELDDLLQELDEDVEGMQSTIFFLQQELKTSKGTISGLELEIKQLKNGANNSDRNEDDEDCIDIVNDQDDHIDDEGHRDKNEMAKKDQKIHHITANSYGNGIPVKTSICADAGNGNETLVNSTDIITNGSVVLRAPVGVDREVLLKLNNSERILRKDKQSVIGGNKMFSPSRTLRSSRRNDVARTSVATKGNNKNSVNSDDTNVIEGDDNDDDEVDIGAERNGDQRSSSEFLELKSNNKRSLEESESNECSSDDESTEVGTVTMPVNTISSSSNHKQILKKARRSSALSLHLIEVDQQIDCGEEDLTKIVNSCSNGTKQTKD